MAITPKSRIDFIDLAKGICILQIVIGHCGWEIVLPGWSGATMPLFFLLSGLFFKSEDDYSHFLLKKCNKILIPFFFFYLISYLCFYAIKVIKPELLVTDARGIWDLFDNRQYFNGPIWFLLALFWCNIFLYAIVKNIKKDSIKIISICALGFIGWFLGYKNMFLPLFFDVALTSLPFFAVGYYFSMTKFAFTNQLGKYNLLIAAGLWGISWIIERTGHHRLSLHYNIIEGWSTYLLGMISALSLLYTCKAIKKLPFISYAGRYSIVLLCVHHLIYRPLKVILPSSSSQDVIVALLTVLLSTACIPFFKQYLPRFIGLKNLINIKQSDNK